jgi:type I restriction enzyme M protein
MDHEAVLSSGIKIAQEALIAKVKDKYDQLTEADIKILVIFDKWIDAMATATKGELAQVSQTLTRRIRELAERYESPLPLIVDEVAKLSAKFDEQLKKMVVAWE